MSDGRATRVYKAKLKALEIAKAMNLGMSGFKSQERKELISLCELMRREGRGMDADLVEFRHLRFL